jgi:hypothetical protein
MTSLINLKDLINTRLIQFSISHLLVEINVGFIPNMSFTSNLG